MTDRPRACEREPVTTPEAELNLFAAREPIFPHRVKGTFRALKWWIRGITLAIYFITP